MSRQGGTARSSPGPLARHEAMMSTLTRLLGDTPGRLIVRLVFLSFVVGVVMAALGLEPAELVTNLVRMVEGLWNLGWDAVTKAWQYFLLGAVVVIPVWLILRVLNVGRGRA
jgi:hypothetical protein